MITNRSSIVRRSLAFPLAGAVLALSASSAFALPVGTGNGGENEPVNQPPKASLKVSPKVALVSHELKLQKQAKKLGLGDLSEQIALEDGDVVKFDASSSSDPEGSALTYDWDLDGNGSYELLDQGPKQSKRYYSTGTFATKVRVHDGEGKSATDTENVIVHNAPKAKISSDTATPLVGQTVKFTSAGSTGDAAIAKTEWDLDGDGTFETVGGSLVDHSYASPGARTIKLRVTDTYGETSVASIIEKVNQLPTAAFTNGPAVAGQPVQFDGSTSSDDSAITKYEWDLDGDGTFETDSAAVPTVSKTYDLASTVNVRLRVTDDLGATSVVAHPVTVTEGAKAGTGNGQTGGGQTGGGATQGTTVSPVLNLTKTKFKLAKNGKVTFKLTAPAGATTYRGTIKLRTKGKKGKTFATAKFTIAGGKSQNVRVLIPASKRKAIRGGSKLSAKAIIAVSDAAGNKGTSTVGILIGL